MEPVYKTLWVSFKRNSIYLVVTVAGFALTGLFGSLIALDTTDNVLHLVLAVALLGAGFGLEE